MIRVVDCFQDTASTCITLATIYILYFLASSIYSAYLSPLARFPGPLSRKTTNFPLWASYARGTQHEDLHKFHQKYGPVVRVTPNFVCFTSAQAVKDIYGFEATDKTNQKWYEWHDFGDAGDGTRTLLTARHADHTRFRRLISHAFSPIAMRSQQPLMDIHITRLISKLRHLSQSGPTSLDLLQWFTMTTFDLIGDLALGKSFGALEAEREMPYMTNVLQTMRLGRVTSAIAGSRALKLLIDVACWIHPALLRGRARLVEEAEVRGRERLALQTSRQDVMAYILRYKDKEGEKGDGKAEGKGKSMSEVEILRNLAVLLAAGGDSTATALAGASYLLLSNPSALDRLRAEIAAAGISAGSDGVEITQALVNEMPYLNGVVKEALRLYPPFPVALPRKLLVDCIIDGHPVPKGTIVGAHHYATFRSEENWRRAEEFCPERWCGDEEFEDDRRGAWAPFSLGPRACIASGLALVETKLILTHLFSNFEIKLKPESKDWFRGQTTHIAWEKPPLMVELAQR